MDKQVFHPDIKPWETNNKNPFGKFKMLLDASMTNAASLKLVQLAPEETFKSHEHNFLQLLYFTVGEGKLVVDSEDFEIQPGLTAIVLPHQCHTVSNTSNNNMEIMVFETYDYAESDTPYVDF